MAFGNLVAFLATMEAFFCSLLGSAFGDLVAFLATVKTFNVRAVG
jgi:hypothetical protein